MDAASGSYLAAIIVSILSLLACTRLSVRSHQHPADLRRLLGFIVAIAIGALVVFSPLDELSDRYFSAHMVEHELLLFSMPVALLAARPLPIVLVAPWRLAPSRWRRSFGKAWNECRMYLRSLALLGHPVPALVVSASALWLWHAPALYELALESEWVHALEHLSFLVTALLYWRPLLSGRHATPLTSNAKRALYLMAGCMQGGLLGALIALNDQVIYGAYIGRSDVQFALADQQIGGAIMWFSGPVFCGAIAALAME